MNKYTTQLRAIDPLTGELKTWVGQHVQGISFEDAERYCQNNGLGYLEVTGELVAEIDYDTDSRVDYDKINQN